MLGFLGISRQAQSSNEAYEFLSTGQEELNGDTPPWALADNRVSSDIETVLGRSSSESSAAPTPLRTSSPPPLRPPHRLSSSISEVDGGPTSPLLAGHGEAYTFRDGIRNLWHLNPNPRRMRTRERKLWRTLKKGARRIVRHPLFPRQPLTIIFALLLFTLFAISLTLLLMYILNPDKEPLPWQAYCSIPPTTTLPPHLRQTLPYPYINSLPEKIPPSFPPDDLDSLPPAGVFLGVFSTDMSLERRMLIRTTWATHPRSRNGAGTGDDGRGTSRTVVRFILGQPRKGWERRIQTEMEMYNDIVILPCPENMNSGKTHAYFTWAAENAWVPPAYFNSSGPVSQFSYSSQSTSAPRPAPHDSHFAWVDHASGHPRPWVRPDYVAKVDDDAFVMLAELESRMRVELYATGHEPYSPVNTTTTSTASAGIQLGLEPSGSMVWKEDSNANPAPSFPRDPLVYWGYLVKERFMAGELYGLSWRLVDWVSTSTAVKGYIQGAEDKQTAKWMTIHPQAGEIRWASERCWIYDHPRAGTVYSHGFLFPSHVERIKQSVLSYIEAASKNYSSSPIQSSIYGLGIPTPPLWSQSSVSTFGVKYQAPLQDITTAESEEALVEGSEMSRIREGTRADVAYAWRHREGRIGRYLNRRVGGTVVVHFIKKHMWFLETALALLEADDYSDFELESLPNSSRETMNVGLSSVWTDSSVFSHKNDSSIVGLIP